MATYQTILKSEIYNETVLYSTPMGKTSVIISMFVANKGMNINSISVFVKRGGVLHAIVYTIPLAIGSTVQPTDGKKVFLEPGDILVISTEELVDVVCSLIEDI